MSGTKTCGKCGAEMLEEAAGGLCPRCLMALNFDSRTMPEDEAPPKAASLTPEEMKERFPQFDILECLGRGGMGVVYKARQKTLDRIVAIKVLAGEWHGDPGFAKRFEKEAKTLAQMNHPNIVTVHDFGETDGLYYIVMEFVDGVNLRDVLKEGALPPEQALAIVPPICDALQYAHDKGIVHRDIKPENLLLDRDGRIKIADFGIATLMGTEGESAGTPPYMAPEQLGAASGVDSRADIYALGVVLYEMLTGERPDKELVAPSKRVQIDVRLDEIVLRALEKTPELRYQSAGEFRTVLQTMSASPQENPAQPFQPPHLTHGVGRKTTRLPWIVFTALYLGFLGYLYGSAQSLPERVASHFDINGNADAWMNRGSYVVFVGILPLALAVILSLVGLGVGRLPARFINIPRRDFWLAPERREFTVEFLSSRLVWLACLITFFFGGLHWSTVTANRSLPAHLAGGSIMGITIGFMIVLMIWVVSLLMRLADTDSLPGAGAPEVTVPFGADAGSTDKPTRSSRKAIHVAAYVCMVLSFTVLFAKWWNEHKREGVWFPARISNAITQQYGDAQVRVVDVSQTGQVVLVSFVYEMFSSDHELIVQYSGPVLSCPNDLVSSVNAKVKDLDCLIASRAKLVDDNMGEVLAGTNVLSGRTMFRVGFVLPDSQTAAQVVKEVQEVHLGRPCGLGKDKGVLLLFSLHRDFGKDAAGKPVVEALDGSLWSRPKSNATAARVPVNPGAPTSLDSAQPLDTLAASATELIAKYFPDVQVRLDKDVFTASHATQEFQIHNRSKSGEAAADAAKETGPSSTGFILRISRKDNFVPTQAAVPQTFRAPYWSTFINAGYNPTSKRGVWIGYAFGTRLNAEFHQQMLELLSLRGMGTQKLGAGTKLGVSNTSPPEFHWQTVTHVSPSEKVIENTDAKALTRPLLSFEKPPITSTRYALIGEIKYENVEESAYLEMWSHFQPSGKYFTRTLAPPGSGPMATISGSSDWRAFTLPFDRSNTTDTLSKIDVNLYLPAKGAVYLRGLRLVQDAVASASKSEQDGTPESVPTEAVLPMEKSEVTKPPATNQAPSGIR